MSSAGKTAVAIAFVLVGGLPLRAEIGPIPIPTFTTGFFPPHQVAAPNQPAGQTIHGIHLVGDWTPGSAESWSAFFYFFPTAAGGKVGSSLNYGGESDADPFHIDAARYLVFPQGAASGGDWRLSFTMTLPGSTAQLTNGAVTLLDNPVSTYSGTTGGGPTWFHPHEGFTYVDQDEMVPYHVQAFRVDATGRYDIYSSHGYDGMLFLYAGGFNPADPLAHAYADNDDGRTGQGSSDIWLNLSGAPLTLTAGQTYFLVTTGMQARDAGLFSNAIGGVGNVTFVPEPGTLMVLLGGSLVAWGPRR